MALLKYRKLSQKIAKFLEDKEVIAIHGSRRVGKTYLLHYINENFLKETVPSSNIFYFDLEDFVLLEMCNKGEAEVVKYLKGKGADFSKKIYLLIDEIQYLENPSSFLKLFHDRHSPGIKLIVTGSSSFLIKKKFTDSLAGRIIDFELFTLDFEEFLDFKDIKYNLNSNLDSLKHELLPLYEEYIIYGGYPSIVTEADTDKKETKLKQIINAYVKKDINDVASIKNLSKFNNLLQILALQSGNLLNTSELANTLSLSRPTIEEYLFILESTYIIKIVYPFHENIRSELTKMPKIFFEDTGMMNLLANKVFSKIISGNLLETGVYALLRRNIPAENIYFWRTAKGQEIDFVVNDPLKNSVTAIEVKTTQQNKSFSSLKFFKQNYSESQIYLCCINKLEKQPGDKVKIFYPWGIYAALLK